MRALALGLALVVLPGCATILNSDTTRVSIRTEPENIKVSTMNGGKRVECVTNCVLTLNNDEDHVLRFEDPEIHTTQRTVKSSVTAWFYVNLVWGGTGLVFMAIDWLTDSMYTLSPGEVFVEFVSDKDEEEEEEDEGEYDEEGEEQKDQKQPNPAAVAEKDGSPQPGPSYEAQPTGVAALPAATPEDRMHIERIVPPARIDEAIRQYYGELNAARRSSILERLYKIMKHQRETAGTPDLDQAIAMEIHDGLR